MSTEIEYRPGLEDVPAAKSGISFLDGKKARLEYRGIPVDVLAKEASFEEVAWMLIKGELPTQKQLAEFDHDLRQRRQVHYKLTDMLRELPGNAHPMDVLQMSVTALGIYYPCRTVNNPAKNWEASLRLIAAIPTVVAAFDRYRRGLELLAPRSDLGHAANFLYMLHGTEPTPAAAKVLDACLTLHAEHTMNASTFTARVTGSTLATPFQSMAAAVGSLSGPLHGGANEEVLVQLEEIGSPENVQKWLDAKRAADPKFKVMGLGHRVYKVKDGRAIVVQDLAENIFAESGRPKNYETALELEKICAGIYGPKGIYPNVDFFSGVVYQALGIPTDLFTPVFAIGRIAGWLAHWTEQLNGNRIFRPEQIFVGKNDVAFVPLEKRP